MRGPGIRLDLDVRRLWTCPECQRQRRLSGDVALPLCPCREGGVMMRLTADSKLLRRAERITPLPYVKQPRPPRPADEEPIADPVPVPEPAPQPTPPVVQQTPVAEQPEDDFGPPLDPPAAAADAPPPA